ncbi:MULTISPECIES: general secretion pathway protein GspN [Pseudomonas]|uniref:general secretion pathway protein GspN n=1 Tax=Pseudomonas TaxID=286 RepID=UPI00236304FC|nr:general secretion pathway protein GspN [Pseudomonas asplenii]
MKIPDRLTLCLGAFVVSMATLCLALFEGLGTGIEWGPEPEAPPPVVPAATVKPEAAPALSSYAGIWQRPLFNRDRQADPSDPAATGDHDTQALAGLSLNGIAVSTSLRKALFKTSDGKSLSAAQGDVLPNGWRVERITAEKVSLSFRSSEQELSIPVLKLPATAAH